MKVKVDFFIKLISLVAFATFLLLVILKLSLRKDYKICQTSLL